MREDKRRYFIELQMNETPDVPRNREAEVRRALATRFLNQISQWIQEEEQKGTVSSVAITALGQVLITCEQNIIARLRENEKLNIVAIRSSAPLADSVQRVSGWQ